MSEIARDGVGGSYVGRLAHRWITWGGRRTLAGGFAIAWSNLGVLGALIGWDGGSRAYGTGLHTLFGDHAAAVVVSWIVAAMFALVVGRWAASTREIGLVLIWVAVADVVAGLAVAAGIGEITIVNLPQVLFTETVAGTQVVAVALGIAGGYALRPRSVRPGW